MKFIKHIKNENTKYGERQMIREIFNIAKEDYLSRNQTPSAEKRIYDAFQELDKTEVALKASFSIPEVNEARLAEGQEKDLKTWSFWSVFKDKLKQNGWPTDTISYATNTEGYPETKSMNELLELLSGRNSRLDSALMLTAYKKRGPLEAAAVSFLREHLDSLEGTVNEMRDFKEADLQSQHTVYICAFPKLTMRPVTLYPVEKRDKGQTPKR
jgi:hypothetical protein